MATIGLVAMIGMMALVVDIGWAYYQKKSAQKAADAASMAGVSQALFNVQNGTPQCGTNVPCQDSTSCPAQSSRFPRPIPISVACLYAQQNGFTAGGAGGKQSVSVAAGTTVPPPTAPGVSRHLLLDDRARVSEQFHPVRQRTHVRCHLDPRDR